MKLLLVGAGGHAEACIDVIEQCGIEIAGLVGTEDQVGQKVAGYTVLGVDDDLPFLVKRFPDVLITVGHIKTPEPRISLWNDLAKLPRRFATVISPRAYVSKRAQVGVGTIIMHGAILNAGAVVGRNCIVNSMALVEHGVTVGDHCHISTGAIVNSGVSIGAGTFIGSQSSVRQSLTIGSRSLIGMGQHIVKDCMDGARVP